MKLILTLFLLMPLSAYSNICNHSDSRVRSNDSRIGKISNSFCTGTLIGKNCMLTSLYCSKFLNTIDFAPENRSDLAARYEVEKNTIQKSNANINLRGISVFRLKKNQLTGAYPGEVQGYYNISESLPKRSSTIRISAYDVNLNQQTAIGPVFDISSEGGSDLYHRVDTDINSTGAGIIDESSDEIFAIHSSGGCSRNWTSRNQGYLISKNQIALDIIKKACE